jgi:hypothetical protein
MGKKNSLSKNESSNLIKELEEFDYAIENGPFITIRSLFPKDYQFPPAESMLEAELTKKLDEISDTLFAHNIDLSFCDNLPDKLMYNHLINEIIPKEMISEKTIKNTFTTLTGCNGACDTCFQKEYCDIEEDE